MLRALDEMVVEPIKTTISFHRKVLNDPDFVNGKYSTHFIERFSSSAPKPSGEQLVGV